MMGARGVQVVLLGLVLLALPVVAEAAQAACYPRGQCTPVVPEPATMASFAAGAAGIGWLSRKRKSKNSR